MKGSRSLEAAYDRLEPWERFQLAVAAAARDDDHDQELLARTCPKRTYLGCEREFLEPFELACDVAHAFAAEILPLAVRLDFAQAAAELATVQFQILVDEIEFAHVRARAGRVIRRATSAAIRETGACQVDLFTRVAETLSAGGAIAAHGFAAFSTEELGLEPETLLAAFARIALPTYERLAAHAADPEQVASYYAELAGVWRFRLGLQDEPTPIQLGPNP